MFMAIISQCQHVTARPHLFVQVHVLALPHNDTNILFCAGVVTWQPGHTSEAHRRAAKARLFVQLHVLGLLHGDRDKPIHVSVVCKQAHLSAYLSCPRTSTQWHWHCCRHSYFVPGLPCGSLGAPVPTSPSVTTGYQRHKCLQLLSLSATF